MLPENEPDDYSDLPTTRVMTIPTASAGQRLDVVLAELLPDFSRSRLAQWIKDGKVLVDNAPATPKTKLWGGESVQVETEPDPETVSYQPEPVPLDIVYEDDALLVLNKPPGLVVHPAAGNWTGTVLNGLLYAFPQLSSVPRAGIVHRLDKDTSGLMVVAKTLAAQVNLVRQLQARTVKRQYLALVEGILETEDTIEAPIGRHPKERTKMAVVGNGGKPAITHWRAMVQYRAHTLVNCRLETGRTHQIRVHMAHIGHPLAGDPLYGGRNRGASDAVKAAVQTFARQALHAAKLGLVHPVTGKNMQWKASLPEDFEVLLDVVRDDLLDDEDDGADVDSWDDGEIEVFYVKD